MPGRAVSISSDPTIDGLDVSTFMVPTDGPDVKLYVDANGAYTPRQALEPFDIRWFEEPVSSDDLEGMRFVREHAGPRVDIAASLISWGLKSNATPLC